MKYLFSVLLFAYSYSLQGQFVAYDFISSFGMKIGIHADGTMFMDEFKSNGCYFVDTEDLGHNTIFSSSLWFSGNQLNGNSVATASTYGGQGSGESFTPGIISQNSFDFNKVWKVSGASIKQLKADYADNENIDGPISNGILAWPGKGNVELPDLPDQDFAPFYDQNGDGIYEPLGGDYPIIGDDLEDIVPHEMIYIVYHDDFTFNGVKLEVHSQFYTLECDNIDVTQSSLFSRHRINKKQNSIENFKFGIWSDFDIGCITDDVLGSIPEMNAHYGYNVDPIDGNIDGECAFGVNSFGDNPGVQSITFLNQNMDAFNAYVGIFMSVPPSMYEPVTPIEYNRVMEGFWRDGTPITIGGDGFDPGSTNTTKYIYHGDPENSTEWSMLSSDLGQYANFPIASSTYGMFNEGEEIIFDLAHIFTQNETLDNIETVSEAKLDIAIIQELYEEKFITECSINTESIASQSIGFSIYPNPSKHMISIQGTDTYDRYEIWNNLGQKVAVGSSTENIFIGEYVSGLYHIKIFKDDDYFNASFIKD